LTLLLVFSCAKPAAPSNSAVPAVLPSFKPSAVQIRSRSVAVLNFRAAYNVNDCD
jgi:hypothetical protein